VLLAGVPVFYFLFCYVSGLNVRLQNKISVENRKHAQDIHIFIFCIYFLFILDPKLHEDGNKKILDKKFGRNKEIKKKKTPPKNAQSRLTIPVSLSPKPVTSHHSARQAHRFFSLSILAKRVTSHPLSKAPA
jgi:hypothetical protein